MKKITKGKKKSPAIFFNRKASFEIRVEEKLEAGIVLTGEEIKSIRAGRVQLNGSFIRLIGDKIQVIGMQIANVSVPQRSRNLLMHTKEIDNLKKELQTRGKVVIPLDLHFKRGFAKLNIGLGVGRKAYDKRALLKERDLERSQKQDLKRLNKSA
jgi:SsrA-binding protein